MVDDSATPREENREEKSFIDELTCIVNRRSKENESNTPDFILAQYLDGCLKAFTTATQQRETWHGRDARPAHTRYGVELGA